MSGKPLLGIAIGGSVGNVVGLVLGGTFESAALVQLIWITIIVAWGLSD